MLGQKLEDILEYSRYLPKDYIISEFFDTPVKEFSDDGDSWAFAFTSFLESSYRKQLIEEGKISNNEYIELSEQALIHECLKFCEKNYNNSEICQIFYAQGGKYFPVIAIPDLLTAGMSKGAFPSSICDYEDSDDRTCYDYDKYEKGLEYKIESLKYTRNLNEMKDLLYFNKKPLLLTIPKPMIQYYIPCNDTSNQEKCEIKKKMCPYNTNEYCDTMRFDSVSGLGDYRIPQEPAKLVSGKPISFLVVGYSDFFISSYGFGHDKTNTVGQGGFIVKNTNNAGFPINYYNGRLTFNYAFSYCPNYNYPGYWKGTPIPCMLTNKSLKLCPANTPKPGKTSKSSNSTILKCLDKTHHYCDENSFYTVAQFPMRNKETFIMSDKSGMASTMIFEISSDGTLKNSSVFNKVPFHRLNDVFQPVENKEMRNDCGYWFIPYDVLNKLVAEGNSEKKSIMALQMNIKFKKSSLFGNIKRSIKKIVKKSEVNPRITSSEDL